MNFSRSNIGPLVKQAELLVGILKAAGYDANIVGGALRVIAVGGETSDIDIAVICSKQEYHLLKKDLGILFHTLGINFDVVHEQVYKSSVGFLADWRCGPINIIAYDSALYPNVKTLVQGFDFNFNMYLQGASGLYNVSPVGTGYVWINTNIASHHNIDRIKTERLPRFRSMLGHLDWSKVNDCTRTY